MTAWKPGSSSSNLQSFLTVSLTHPNPIPLSKAPSPTSTPWEPVGHTGQEKNRARKQRVSLQIFPLPFPFKAQFPSLILSSVVATSSAVASPASLQNSQGIKQLLVEHPAALFPVDPSLSPPLFHLHL